MPPGLSQLCTLGWTLLHWISKTEMSVVVQRHHTAAVPSRRGLAVTTSQRPHQGIRPFLNTSPTVRMSVPQDVGSLVYGWRPNGPGSWAEGGRFHAAYVMLDPYCPRVVPVVLPQVWHHGSVSPRLIFATACTVRAHHVKLQPRLLQQ